MEQLLPIVIQVVTGVIAGNSVTAMLKQTALGVIGKSLAGAVGGVGGTALLAMLGGGDLTSAMGGLAGSAVSGAAGGAILTGGLSTILGMLKK